MLERAPAIVAASPAASAPIAPPKLRDQRLDMFRGLALVMIFINHVPGTVYENFTTRNFGFSDAAEAFVFMSGMAAGLAYSSGFLSGSLWLATARVWARARQLYLVHLAITLLCLAVFAAAALWFDVTDVLTKNNLPAIFKQPLSAAIGLPLMTHQLGYLNILPLYIILLVATPLFFLIGLRRPWLLLGLSVLGWIVAGQFRLNLPNYPTSGGWFFDPLSWQLLFVIGLLSGCAMKQGRSFLLFSRVWFWLAAGFLLFILAWAKNDALAAWGRSGLGWLSARGAPFYVTWFDKTFVALPRLLHALALFYVMSSIPAIRRFADGPLAAPLKLMGRQGLPVFAVGTVLSMVGQSIKAPRLPDPLFDGLLLASGIALLLALAWTLDQTRKLKTAPLPV